MKRLFILYFLCIFISFGIQAQDALKKATSPATAMGFDVKSLTTSIMNKLVPSLKITDNQKPGVTDAISGFLVEKSKILPLQQSNPPTYASKQGSLFNTLKSKLGGALTSGQLTKFLTMKPKTYDPLNELSSIFY